MSSFNEEGYPVFDLRTLRDEAENTAARDAEWDRVFIHFQPRLKSYFERRAEGVLPVDDLLQEVWLRACLNVRTLESSGALWSWLTTIGTNLLRDQLRRKRPEEIALETRPTDTKLSVDDFLHHLVDRPHPETDERLSELTTRLTADEIEYLNLLYVDNLTHEEVARRLDLKSAMASRQRLRRIRQRLAE